MSYHFKPTSLTIAEARDYLCAEHAARLFIAECWWAIVPSGDNHLNSFASSGDSSSFWALVLATQSMGQPLGYNKVVNHLGRTTNQPHKDPEQLLRSIIKPDIKTVRPDHGIVTKRAQLAGLDGEAEYAKRMEQYNEQLAADQARIDTAVKTIMAQQPVGDINEDAFVLGHRVEEVFDEEGNVIDYTEVDVTGGEWEIPIDRIIEFGEKQIKFLATNQKVSDVIFGSETLIWEQELEALKHIVQQRENEGAYEGSREIDDALLSGAGMAAGMNSGK